MKIGVAVALAGAMAYWLRPASGPQPTPPPTDSQLRAFTALVPATFRSEIAHGERELGRTAPLKPNPVPTAVGIDDGVGANLVPPPVQGTVTGGANHGQLSYDGSYLAPRVPQGNLMDTVWYRSPKGFKELRLILSRRSATARHTLSMGWDGVFASGEPCTRDLGPLRLENGRYRYSAPGTRGDGFSIVPSKGAPPRLLALAPEEIPSAIPAEPEGYALLFDQVVLGRDTSERRGYGTDFIDGPSVPFLPASIGQMFLRRRTVEAETHEYRLMSLAHVYVRKEGRWRYARSWTLHGGGAAYMATDDALFRKAHVKLGLPPPALGPRSPSGASPEMGAPQVLTAYQVDPVKP